MKQSWTVGLYIVNYFGAKTPYFLLLEEDRQAEDRLYGLHVLLEGDFRTHGLEEKYFCRLGCFEFLMGRELLLFPGEASFLPQHNFLCIDIAYVFIFNIMAWGISMFWLNGC